MNDEIDDNVALLSLVRVEVDPTAPNRKYYPEPQQAVRASFNSTARGNIDLRSVSNIHRIFEMDTRWQGRLKYNLLSHKYMIDGNVIEKVHVSEAQRWIEEVYEACFGRDMLEAVMILHAKENPYHPIRDYFDSLPSPTLLKSGEVADPIVDTFLMDVFGAEDSELNRVYARSFFMSCVKRALEPGSKSDSMLVLVGKQGLGKSSFFRSLCKDPLWFTDSKLKIGSKDAYDSIRGKWIIEMSELSSIRKSDNDLVKSFLSGQVDSFRPPYERQVRDFPRSCVFVGTVNDVFLNDVTGSRRYWPVKVTKQITDFSAIVAMRDKLWAEAYHFYKDEKGEVTYWLTPELEEERQLLAVEHALDDGWEQHIDEFLVIQARKGKDPTNPKEWKKARFSAKDLLSFLGLETHQIKTSHIVRVNAVLKESGAVSKRERGVSTRRKFTFWYPAPCYVETVND